MRLRSDPWRHLAVLTALATAFLYAVDLLTGAPVRAGGWAAAPAAAWRALPEALYMTLPPVGALALGTLPFGRRPARTAAQVVAAVTAAMLVLHVAALHVAALQPAPLRVDAGHAADEAARAARWATFTAVLHAAALLLPAVLAGLMLGVQVWVSRRVRFRTPPDARVARWLLAWLLVPGACAVVLQWSQGYAFAVVFRGEPLWLPVLPYLPAGLLAALGWRAAARLAVDPLDEAEGAGAWPPSGWSESAWRASDAEAGLAGADPARAATGARDARAR